MEKPPIKVEKEEGGWWEPPSEVVVVPPLKEKGREELPTKLLGKRGAIVVQEKVS